MKRTILILFILVSILGYSQEEIPLRKIPTSLKSDVSKNSGKDTTGITHENRTLLDNYTGLGNYYTITQSKDSFNVSFFESNGQYILQQGSKSDTVGAEAPSIGDRYAGGDVFYIHSSGTWGMCASPVALTSQRWAPTGYSPGYVSPDVQYGFGYGEINTGYIVAYHSPTGTDFAAYACDTVTINGYSDFFLPSVGEMDTMYANLIDGFGGTSYPGSSYWTSSESSSLDSRTYNITTGADSYIQKYTELNVIPVRTFTIPATAPSGGSGITSVAISSSDITVTGSPITESGTIVLNYASNSVNGSDLNESAISGQSLLSSIYGGYELLIHNGSSLNRTTVWTLQGYIQDNWSYPEASSSKIGCVYAGVNSSGTYVDEGIIAQSDNNLGLATALGTDKIGFWDVSANAQKYCLIEDLPVSGGSTGSTDLSTTYATTSVTVNSSTGTNATISAATETTAGALSATDKATINSIKSIVPQDISNTLATETANAENYLNFYTTVSSDKTILFTNVDDGDTGNIEVIYTGSSVITISEYITEVTNIILAPNIEGTSSTKILTKSTGNATYSYWRRGATLYIVGTQF